MTEQRTAEWFAERLGKVGCSRLSDVLAGDKTAARRNYMAELICERLTGERTESFTTDAMQWGIDTEPLAKEAYMIETWNMVEEHGGKEHDEIPHFRGSPDGLILPDGGVEIKCPKTATHLDTLMHGTVKKEYIYQMAGYVSIYHAAWWDFVSYDPRLKGHELFIKRFLREELPVQEVEEGVKRFLEELDEMMKKLEGMNGK